MYRNLKKIEFLEDLVDFDAKAKGLMYSNFLKPKVYESLYLAHYQLEVFKKIAQQGNEV